MDYFIRKQDKKLKNKIKAKGGSQGKKHRADGEGQRGDPGEKKTVRGEGAKTQLKAHS